MKALTGNFALLSVNLLVRCIQTILLGSVIERNFSLRLNFRHVRRLVIFHFGASALRRFDNDIDRVAVKCGKRVNPGPRMAVVDPLAFLAARHTVLPNDATTDGVGSIHVPRQGWLGKSCKHH